MVKLLRAYGECLGTSRRWRTWQAAISNGEKHLFYDPLISEWGNPITSIWIYRIDRANSGKWTISVPEGKENNSDSASSGERTRNSLNRLGLLNRGRGIRHNENEREEKGVEKPSKERARRVSEANKFKFDTRVMRNTRNSAWICRDHPVRLNTPKWPIVNQYREGKVKRTPVRGVK